LKTCYGKTTSRRAQRVQVAYPPLPAELTLFAINRKFEANFAKLIPNFLPSLIAPVGHKARAALSDGLLQYYRNNYDAHESASEFVRLRAAHVRKYNIPDDQLSKFEVMLPFAALVNTVPTLFWFFSFVMSRDNPARGHGSERPGSDELLSGDTTARGPSSSYQDRPGGHHH
jgi:hypothetical protein